MSEKNFAFSINHESDIPKYQQLVNCINNAIAENLLSKGDLLPSVNAICKDNKLSRDTVFKAYSILKDQKVIESVPNKGYYVAGETRKVLCIIRSSIIYQIILLRMYNFIIITLTISRPLSITVLGSITNMW
jgi:DNA-binding transcriptional regulator YhcF (GntR family)